MTWMLVSFFAYMVVILVVGFLAARKTTNTMESFYLGDRKVGAWVTAISASASSESGWLVLGLVAMGYIYGVAAYWVTFGCVLGFLERSTGAKTPFIRLIGVGIIFILMFTYVAAQLNAAGVALEAVFS